MTMLGIDFFIIILFPGAKTELNIFLLSAQHKFNLGTTHSLNLRT